MNHIIYRAKRLLDGEWVFGNLNIDARGIYSIREMFWGGEEYPIYEDTIGIFTGLQDKDGINVFEGDILKGYFEMTYPVVNIKSGKFATRYRHIEWFTEYGCWHLFRNSKKKPIKEIGVKQSDLSLSWEVIGNVFDTPDIMLLKETKMVTHADYLATLPNRVATYQPTTYYPASTATPIKGGVKKCF
jgi:uncharacterized phage protein (TIGR01671 family)